MNPHRLLAPACLAVLVLEASPCGVTAAQRARKAPVERWAVVMATHNDFYPYVENAGFEQGQNNAPDHWVFFGSPDCPGQPGNCITTGFWDGHSAGITIQQILPNQSCECCAFWQQGPGNQKPIPVIGGAFYNLSALVVTMNVPPNLGQGASIELNWYDRNGRFLRQDASPRVAPPFWALVSVLDSTTQLALIHAPASAAMAEVNLLFCSGVAGPSPCAGSPGPAACALFDDVAFTLASDTDNDGMAANALSVYERLERHGYDDAHIRLLVYHTGDDDVRRTFGGPNLLNGPDGMAASGDEPVIDHENAQVTRANFLAALAAVRAEVARSKELRREVVLYITSHGLPPPADVGSFSFEQTGESMDENELAAELALFPTSARITAYLDFCWSGLCHDALAAANVISISAGGDQVSYAFPENHDAKFFAPVVTAAQLTLTGMDARFGDSYAVGTGGSIYRLQGGAASLVRSGNEVFNDIAFRPPLKSYALVVGNVGVIDKFDPATNGTTAIASGTISNLTGVDFTPDGRYAVIVGLGGTVLLFDATDESVTSLSSSGDDLYDVACRRVNRPTQGAADDFYEATVVGAAGTIDTYRGWYNEDTGAEDFFLSIACTQGAATLRAVGWEPDERFLPPAGAGAGDPSWIWGKGLVVGDSGALHLGTGAACGWSAVAGTSANDRLQDVVWRPEAGYALIVGFDDVANVGVAYATDSRNLQTLPRPVEGFLYAAAWDDGGLPIAYTTGRSVLAGASWQLLWMEYLVHSAGSFFFMPFHDELESGDALLRAFKDASASHPIPVGPQANLTVKQIQNPQHADGIGDIWRARIW